MKPPPLPIAIALFLGCVTDGLAAAVDAPTAAVPPSAATWTIDPGRSTIQFIGVSTLHRFEGTARVRSGQVDLTPGVEQGSVTIDAGSMQTGNSSRDREMHQDHMQVDTYPAIDFQLKRLTRGEGGHAVASGIWTMHGVSQPLDVPITLPALADPAHPAQLTAHFTLDMRQWHITPPTAALGTIRVHPEVQVDVVLALLPALPPTPLASVTLLDQEHAHHDLGMECRGRLLLCFGLDQRITAKRCDQILSRHLPAQKPLVRVIEAPGITEQDRQTLEQRLHAAVGDTGVRFCIDSTGEVATRLHLQPDQAMLVGFTADGHVAGAIAGAAEAQPLTAALRLVDDADHPEVLASECATGGRR